MAGSFSRSGLEGSTVTAGALTNAVTGTSGFAVKRPGGCERYSVVLGSHNRKLRPLPCVPCSKACKHKPRIEIATARTYYGIELARGRSSILNTLTYMHMNNGFRTAFLYLQFQWTRAVTSPLAANDSCYGTHGRNS